MKVCLSGADKHVENDEPLFSSSSSDEEQDGDEATREQEPAALQPLNPRKRRAGHTPLDLAKCLKVTSSPFKIKAQDSVSPKTKTEADVVSLDLSEFRVLVKYPGEAPHLLSWSPLLR